MVEIIRDAIETVGIGLDAVGVGAIALGGVVAVWLFFRGAPANRTYRGFRQNFGRAILLGLEILVAADIIRTVAVEPTMTNVAVLAVIVLVRTFLSFSLEVELEGKWPWHRSRSKHTPAGEAGAPRAP